MMHPKHSDPVHVPIIPPSYQLVQCSLMIIIPTTQKVGKIKPWPNKNTSERTQAFLSSKKLKYERQANKKVNMQQVKHALRQFVIIFVRRNNYPQLQPKPHEKTKMASKMARVISENSYSCFREGLPEAQQLRVAEENITAIQVRKKAFAFILNNFIISDSQIILVKMLTQSSLKQLKSLNAMIYMA